MLRGSNVLRSSGRAAISNVESASISNSNSRTIGAELHGAAMQWLRNNTIPGSRDASYNRQRGNSTSEYLLKGNGASAKRGIVSSATHQELKAIHQSLATLPDGVPPFQAPGMCQFQAIDIIESSQMSKRAKHKSESLGTVPEGADVDKDRQKNSAGLLKRIVAALTAEPTMQAVKLQTAEQLLDIYSRHGPFVLRGPKLDDPRQPTGYLDHAVAVMTIVKVRIDQNNEKIVVCALDCNDEGKDDETVAARMQAAELGKPMRKLTQTEASGCGADTRRIRFIEAHSIVSRLSNYALDLQIKDVDIDCEAIYMGKGAPILTVEQEKRLEDLIANNWSEVEDYSKDDYSHLAQHKFRRST